MSAAVLLAVLELGTLAARQLPAAIAAEIMILRCMGALLRRRLKSLARRPHGAPLGAAAVVGGRLATGLGHAEMGHISVPRQPGDELVGEGGELGDEGGAQFGGQAHVPRASRRHFSSPARPGILPSRFSSPTWRPMTP